MRSLLILATICLASAIYNGILSPTPGTHLVQGQNFTLVVAPYTTKSVDSVALRIHMTDLQTGVEEFYGNFPAIEGEYAIFDLDAPDRFEGPANITVEDIVGSIGWDGKIIVDTTTTPVYSVTVMVVSI